MVIGTNDDYNHNDDDYDNDGVINSVRIETLDDPVPPCLWSLNHSINQSEPISSHIASVLGKLYFSFMRVFILKELCFV